MAAGVAGIKNNSSMGFRIVPSESRITSLLYCVCSNARSFVKLSDQRSLFR